MTSSSSPPTRQIYADGLRIAIVGCGHGKLDTIYSAIESASSTNNYVVDLLIITGDFEALRNKADFNSLVVPPKYRHLGDFHRYYSGEKKAPVLTLFIGGNHESSSYLAEMFYGGWAAPNIYYLGAAGVVRIGNLRIGGISGIFDCKTENSKNSEYYRAHNEKPPYSWHDMHTVYMVREFDEFKLDHISSPIDVMLSHDWPWSIENYGDIKRLKMVKRPCVPDMEAGLLNSKPAWNLLESLRPRYWFSGHHHTRFAGVVDHEALNQDPEAIKRREQRRISREKRLNAPKLKNVGAAQPYSHRETKGPDQQTPSLPEGRKPNTTPLSTSLANLNPFTAPYSLQPSTPRTPGNHKTHFLALAKPFNPQPPEEDSDSDHHPTPTRYEARPTKSGPKGEQPTRQAQAAVSNWLEIMTVDFAEPMAAAANRMELTYDAEWLAIIKAFSRFPPNKYSLGRVSASELMWAREWVEGNIVAAGKLVVPENFEITAAPYHRGQERQPYTGSYWNRQTDEFCRLLDMQNWVKVSPAEFAENVRDWEGFTEAQKYGEKIARANRRR